MLSEFIYLRIRDSLSLIGSHHSGWLIGLIGTRVSVFVQVLNRVEQEIPIVGIEFFNW